MEAFIAQQLAEFTRKYPVRAQPVQAQPFPTPSIRSPPVQQLPIKRTYPTGVIQLECSTYSGDSDFEANDAGESSTPEEVPDDSETAESSTSTTSSSTPPDSTESESSSIGMKRLIRKYDAHMSVQQLLVRSSDRIRGTPDDFIVEVPAIENLAGITLLSASIPNTIYNVVTSNNTIYWNRGGALSATIASGAYDITALQSVLATAMDTADGLATYTVEYSPTTMKVSILCTSAFSLTTTSTTNAIWDVLGFDTSAGTALATSHTANNVVRLDFPPYLLISLGDWAPLDCHTTAGFLSSYVVSMYNNSQYVQVFNQLSNFDNSSLYTARIALRRLTVKLRQPDGSPADLNGADWSFLLGLIYNAPTANSDLRTESEVGSGVGDMC